MGFNETDGQLLTWAVWARVLEMKMHRKGATGDRDELGGPSPETNSLTQWRWPLVVVILAVLVFLGGRAAYRMVVDGVLLGSLADSAAGLAESFRTENITTTFVSAIPRIAPDSGAKLELVAIEGVESFSRVSDRRIFFDLVPLGATVSEIRVPVTYRYHLRLDDPWHIEVDDHACIVHAPEIRATLPPAIHTDGLEKRSSSGWLRFDDEEQMVALERSLTERLGRRAADPDSIDLVRETCRREVAEFVRNWLLAEDHWRNDRFRSVTVVFPDEEAGDPSALPPTLTLRSPR